MMATTTKKMHVNPSIPTPYGKRRYPYDSCFIADVKDNPKWVRSLRTFIKNSNKHRPPATHRTLFTLRQFAVWSGQVLSPLAQSPRRRSVFCIKMCRCVLAACCRRIPIQLSTVSVNKSFTCGVPTRRLRTSIGSSLRA